MNQQMNNYANYHICQHTTQTFPLLSSNNATLYNRCCFIMAERGDINFIRYIYRGEEGEIIPREATHITVAKDVTFVRANAFREHPHIVEIICHEGVKGIGEEAFWGCSNLRRVIMPGVKIVEKWAFNKSAALTDVECGKLERIGQAAFGRCSSLRSINLPSARNFKLGAFNTCDALLVAKFGNTLERFEERTFVDCPFLERITIPLKVGIIAYDDIFMKCENLKHVDLAEGAVLQKTIAALQLEEWRNDVSEEIDSINRVLPGADAGDFGGRHGNPGEKAQAIRRWISSVLGKIVHYKAEHQRVLNEAAATLQLAFPHDILMNNVLPFLELPALTSNSNDSDGE